MKIKSLYIDNFKILKNFKINFCDNEGVNPITVLTGINGCGKTSLLEFIFQTFKNKKIPAVSKNSIIKIKSEGLLPDGLLVKLINDPLLPTFNSEDDQLIEADFFKSRKKDTSPICAKL